MQRPRSLAFPAVSSISPHSVVALHRSVYPTLPRFDNWIDQPGSLAERHYAHQRPGRDCTGASDATLGSALEPSRERNGQGSLYRPGRLTPVEAPQDYREIEGRPGSRRGVSERGGGLGGPGHDSSGNRLVVIFSGT